MRRGSAVSIAAAAVVAAAAIIGVCFRPVAAERTELLLYCGAGIRPAASALIEAFEAGRAVRIVATYEGSGQLLGKISAGARGDLFMPGAEMYVDKAIELGLARAETKRVAGFFVPVLFVQKGNPKGIVSLNDLTRDGVRVGLGDERSAAVGQTALEILRKNGIAWEEVRRNVVYRSGTVNELGVAVQMGTVDAAILWDANARQFAGHGEMIPIPGRQNVVSTIPIVVLDASGRPAEARGFTEFVTSEEGRRILASHGFTVSPPEAPEIPRPAQQEDRTLRR